MQRNDVSEILKSDSAFSLDSRITIINSYDIPLNFLSVIAFLSSFDSLPEIELHWKRSEMRTQK